MYDDVEDTDEEPDVDDIEVNAEVGYTNKCACTQMLKDSNIRFLTLGFLMSHLPPASNNL
jgi:hypothetical protein